MLGNAALVTGLSASSISSGTSNVNVVSSGGNVTTGIGGTANVLVAATTGLYVTGVVSATGNVTGASLVGTIATAAQATITSLGTLTSLIVTGNTTSGNVLTGGLLSAAGAITGAALTGSSLTVTTGNVTAGNIVNGNANGVGNIGSATTYFNTVFAKATSAQYADLAEIYLADAAYAPGTLVVFGGTHEITVTHICHDARVAGIISTDPAYLMNTGATGLPVALTGRVPARVVGQINKGDRLVSSTIPGVAIALDPDKYEPGCIIGKSLEEYDSGEIGTIEIAVGRY